jgi:hypothetical protein
MKTKDKTVSKTISFIGFSGGGMWGMVDLNDGRIVRVRPFIYDWKYDRNQVHTHGTRALWTHKRIHLPRSSPG